jgi:hypothetical protein
MLKRIKHIIYVECWEEINKRGTSADILASYLVWFDMLMCGGEDLVHTFVL